MWSDAFNQTDHLKGVVSFLPKLCLLLLCLCTVIYGPVASSQVLSIKQQSSEREITIPEGEYEITAKTILPHLEENLTHTDTVNSFCLDRLKANIVFPILNHPAFTGCRLVRIAAEARVDATLILQCKNSQVATGRADVLIAQNRFSAQLNIKMGAKNMTMTQRVSAIKTAACKAD